MNKQCCLVIDNHDRSVVCISGLLLHVHIPAKGSPSTAALWAFTIYEWMSDQWCQASSMYNTAQHCCLLIHKTVRSHSTAGLCHPSVGLWMCKNSLDRHSAAISFSAELADWWGGPSQKQRDRFDQTKCPKKLSNHLTSLKWKIK